MTRLCFSLKDPHIPAPRLCLLNEEWAGLSDRKDHESTGGKVLPNSEIEHVRVNLNHVDFRVLE